MPTINDFTESVNPTILNRGLQIYRDGQIRSIKETVIGLWSAKVKGTTLYDVAIRLQNDNIQSVQCNCPYNRSEYCKHVLAVLLYIKDSLVVDQPLDPPDSPHEQVANDSIQDLLDNLDKNELIQLVNAVRLDNAEIDKTITLKYGSPTSKKENDYRKIVKSIFTKAYRKNSFIDYHETFALSKKSEPLIRQLQEWSEERKHNEVAKLSFEIMLALSKAVSHMDDSGGVMGDIFFTAKQFLASSTSACDQDVKQSLCKLFFKHHLDDGFTEYGFDGDLLELSIPTLTTDKEKDKFLEEVQKGLDKAKSAEWQREYRYEYYIMTLLAFYKHIGDNDSYVQHIDKYIKYDKVRALKVDQLIAINQIPRAIKLCQKGIAIALNNDHPGTADEWQRKILEIATASNDKAEIRRLALLLMKSFQSNRPKLYALYKSTFTKKEWRTELPIYIDQLNAINIDHDIVANILIKENKPSLILDLFKNRDAPLYVINEYQEYVLEDDSGFVVGKYREEIKNLTTLLGRKNYVKIAEMISRLNNIQQGKDEAKKIIHDLKLKYVNRPAMMEELEKVFPGMF